MTRKLTDQSHKYKAHEHKWHVEEQFAPGAIIKQHVCSDCGQTNTFDIEITDKNDFQGQIEYNTKSRKT